MTYVVYEVVASERYAVSNATDAVTTLVQFLPNTEYCFEVTAVDATGNESIASNQACTTTLAGELAEWTVFLGCQGQAYLLEERLDLDIGYTTSVSILGEGSDYDGTTLAYSLSGVYSSDSQILDGEIVWTFEGSSLRRRDLFSANLSTGDSGDVAMDQVEVTGCDALIRLSHGESQEPSASASGVTATASDTQSNLGPSSVRVQKQLDR